MSDPESSSQDDLPSPQSLPSEVSILLLTIQRHAQTLSGGSTPEIMIRVRPTGSAWVGCQCDVFRHASGTDIEHALRSFSNLLEVECVHRMDLTR